MVFSFSKRFLLQCVLTALVSAQLTNDVLPAQAQLPYQYFRYLPYQISSYTTWPVQNQMFSTIGPAWSMGSMGANPLMWYGSSWNYHAPNYWNNSPTAINGSTFIPDNYRGANLLNYRQSMPSQTPSNNVPSEYGPAGPAPGGGQQQMPYPQPSRLGMGTPQVPIQNNANSMAEFINRVNLKYNGNIADALFDPETRTFAKNIGLVNADGMFDVNLSPAHVQLIKNILQDSTLAPADKINSIRPLLK